MSFYEKIHIREQSRKKMKKKFKPILISVVILSVVGYLMITGLRGTMTYFLTVSEVLSESPGGSDQTIRVGGNVTPDSVQWDAKDLQLHFKMEDGQSILHVNYQGVVPDSFKPGREVVVEGRYIGEGRFTATTIMPKCASKYE